MATQEQLACIFCGRSILLSRISPETFENWDIDWKVLQTREILAGPGRGKTIKGRGHGFPVLEGQSLSILEMAENNVHPDIVEGIKSRLTRIVKAYIEAGIIDRASLF